MAHSEMVDRVARVVEDQFTEISKAWMKSRPEAAGLLWAIAPVEAKRIARAAITAMREPTADMLLAGHGANLCENAPEVWQAMIDEALR